MKDWKYILYVVIAVGLLILLKMTSPKQFDWTVTFDPVDKNPYGGFALSELLPSMFPDRNIERSYLSLYEIKDSLRRKGNLLILTTGFHCDKPDTKALLSHISEGGSAFISAHTFSGELSDTLKLETRDYYFLDHDWMSRRDTTWLKFTNTAFDTTAHYQFRKDNIYNFFSEFDTTRATVITRNDRGRPVTIQFKWGKGNLILNTTPMVFTNIYLLAEENHTFVSGTLSYLPVQNLEWTQFYQMGRMESRTPLRFVLKTEPLKWAYLLSIVSLLLFMVFEMKRKQRIIPVIEPLSNTTLEFVSTIGNLYYQNKEHRNIAEKKILFLMEQIRTRYFLSTTRLDSSFEEALSLKSGKAREEVAALLSTIKRIRDAQSIDVEELILLNEKIEKFYTTTP